jgi:hypothetical protein
MPKGVPQEILRAVFRGVRRPKPGQFLSAERAFRLRDALTTFYAPPKRRAGAKKAPKPAPPLEPEVERYEAPEAPEYEEGVLEWEVGLEYRARVRTSNVAFNARFSRKDGGLISERQAREILRLIVYTGEAPEGIRVESVWWQRRRGGVKRFGRVGEMRNFYDILGTVGDAGMATTPLRLGAVKRDRL